MNGGLSIAIHMAGVATPAIWIDAPLYYKWDNAKTNLLTPNY
jgi:hypothetical protein